MRATDTTPAHDPRPERPANGRGAIPGRRLLTGTLLLLTALAASPPAPASSSNTTGDMEDEIVDAYTTLAGRTPGVAEIAYWRARADERATRAELVHLLAHEGEPVRLTILLYQEALGRAPDAAELAYWSAQARRPRGETALVAGILASTEAAARTTTPERVETLYRIALGRDPDPAGLAHWSAVLGARPVDPGPVLALWHSPEARAFRVTSAYRRVLRRDPDPAGLAHWSASGTDDADLSAALADTDEFWPVADTGGAPFPVPGARVLSTLTGDGTVTFILSFDERTTGERFCGIVTDALAAAQAAIALGCSPDRPFVLGAWRGRTLLIASTDLRTFTVTVGDPPR